jgi:hypothetical protein
MPTRAVENGGVGGAAKMVAEHASSIAKLELELAGLELKKKAVSLGLGVGLGIGAALLGLLMLVFSLATIAPSHATIHATWLDLLIVTAALALFAGLLGILALGRIRKGTPPVPEKAIHEAKLTSEALKS